MPLIETVLGNANDPEWRARLAHAHVDTLDLSQWDAQKSRLRKTTRDGLPLAVSLERGEVLRNGDVLLWDDAERRAVVCRIDLCDVLDIDLSGLDDLSPARIVERAVRIGHALGNQHWPAVCKGGHVYVPITVDRNVVASVMKTHHFEGVEYRFVQGEDILDTLDPAEARRLFGGSEVPAHGHGPHGHGHHHPAHGRKERRHAPHRHDHDDAEPERPRHARECMDVRGAVHV